MQRVLRLNQYIIEYVFPKQYSVTKQNRFGSIFTFPNRIDSAHGVSSCLPQYQMRVIKTLQSESFFDCCFQHCFSLIVGRLMLQPLDTNELKHLNIKTNENNTFIPNEDFVVW